MSHPSGERRGGKIVKEYIYTEPSGNPFHKIERTDEKQFVQSHWVNGIDGFKNGHWKWGAPQYKRYPYFVTGLMEAPADEIIFYPEGEKDAESIMDLGLVATTNSESLAGFSKWWSEHLAQYFTTKKRVAILGDNDTIGRRLARMKAEALIAIVPDVRIVYLPDLPDGGDVTDWIAAGGTKAKLIELFETAPKFKPPATIQIIAGRIAEAIDDTEKALMETNQAVLVRAGNLVQPIWSKFPTSRAGIKTQTTTLKVITPDQLIYMLNKHAARYTKWNAKEKRQVEIDPPYAVARGVTARGHWSFPRCTGVINNPTLRPDGTILTDEGHDRVTGLWYWRDKNIKLDVKEKPTKKDALEALALLKDLFAEVAFVDARLDLAVTIAAVLTAVGRGAFEVAPMFLFRAPSPGSGKSYIVDVIAHIASGRWCPVITATGGTEEIEKRLGSLLLEGVPIVSLDNLSRDLQGDILCQMTERPIVKVRVLGKSETPEIEWRGVLFATGNNVGFAGDMTRRGLVANIDPACEKPEQKTFNKDPIAMVLADRGKYVGAALTIIRHPAVDMSVEYFPRPSTYLCVAGFPQHEPWR
jgi:hypothetical protein